jgi:uncharacterized membrane protein YgcG
MPESYITSTLQKSYVTSKLQWSRLFSMPYPVPPYVAGKTIIATYSGPMSSIYSAIGNMNAVVPEIMALMAFNDDSGLSGYQWNYDFGSGTTVVIADGEIVGGFTAIGSPIYSSLAFPASISNPSVAAALAAADSAVKTLRWTWLYLPWCPPGTARGLFLDDAINDETIGTAPPGANHYANVIAVAPTPDAGITLNEGGVFMLPPPPYRGVQTWEAFAGGYGVAAGGQIYFGFPEYYIAPWGVTLIGSDWNTDYTDSTGAGGTGPAGGQGAGGGSGGAGGGGSGPL